METLELNEIVPFDKSCVQRTILSVQINIDTACN